MCACGIAHGVAACRADGARAVKIHVAWPGRGITAEIGEY